MKLERISPPRFARSLVAMAITLLLCAAPAFSASGAAITVTDALGRIVTFPRPPERIVVAGKAVFMLADAAYLFPEASSRIVAIGRTAQGALDYIAAFDPAYAGKIILESNAGPEQIAVAKPDAIFLKSSVAQTLGSSIEPLGVPIVYFDFETPAQYERDLATLGAVFGNPERARQLVAAYRSRMDRIAKVLEGLKEEARPRVLLLYHNDQGGAVSFNVPPLAWMQTMLVQMAGGRPAWKDAQLGQGWTKVSIEQIAAWNPDQVYVISYFANPADVVKRLAADAQWRGLRAVKQGRLLPFPGDFYSWDQPDTRWILGLAWLAARVNPERFAGQDLRREVESFYADFYRMDRAAFERIVLPHLGGVLP